MDEHTSHELAYKKGYEAGNPKWIPVTERLPEFEMPVLISLHLQGDVFARVGWLHESGMWSVPTTKKWLSDAVTHWMPLPEPPKGE